jgi:Domain of unknown function (DU1801)
MATANKTQITQVSVADFITHVEAPARREEANTILSQLEALTGVKAQMWGPSIIGFGSYTYKYDSGREGTSPIVAFSPRKPQIVFYGLDVDSIDASLGKYTTGKGCLYVKKLSDVNSAVLADLIQAAWKARQT